MRVLLSVSPRASVLVVCVCVCVMGRVASAGCHGALPVRVHGLRGCGVRGMCMSSDEMRGSSGADGGCAVRAACGTPPRWTGVGAGGVAGVRPPPPPRAACGAHGRCGLWGCMRCGHGLAQHRYAVPSPPTHSNRVHAHATAKTVGHGPQSCGNTACRCFGKGFAWTKGGRLH